MPLSREERDARRERDRAVIESARQAERLSKIDVIRDTLRGVVSESFAAHVATCVYDGLTARHYVIAHFATGSDWDDDLADEGQEDSPTDGSGNDVSDD